MNLQTRYPTTADEFLRWNEGREGKREFVNGRVVEMMVGVSERHAWIVSRLHLQIASRIGLKEFIVSTAEFGVKTREGVRYPDLIVSRPSGKPRNLAAKTPIFIAQVLSPTSRDRDLTEKANDYLGLVTLDSYLVLSQDEPRAWLWSRHAESWTGPDEVEGMSGIVKLHALNLTFDLAAIYEGIIE